MDIKFEEISEEYKKGKAYFCGQDKEGRLILVLKPSRHLPDDSDVDKTLKLGYYLIEKATQYAMVIQQHQFVVIYDRSGVTRKNMDRKLLGMVKELVSSLQNYYPERTHRVHVLHSNWFYHTIFALVKPFLHANTRNKISLVSKMEDLKIDIAADQLTNNHGGIYLDPYDNLAHLENFGEGDLFALYDLNAVKEFQESQFNVL